MRSANRDILTAVAGRIQPLLPDLVFVGGQIVELYLTDPAATRIRPTKDVDVVVAGTRNKYHKMEERLRDLKFQPDQSPGAPICRWRSHDGYVLDLMSVDETVLGFSNEWYPAVVERSEEYHLTEDLTIAVPRAAVFVATKLAAFRSRGDGDVLGSHDLEDIITVVAGRPELLDELRMEPTAVRIWVARSIADLLDMADFDYAVFGALPDATSMEYRHDILMRFRSIADMVALDT